MTILLDHGNLRGPTNTTKSHPNTMEEHSRCKAPISGSNVFGSLQSHVNNSVKLSLDSMFFQFEFK